MTRLPLACAAFYGLTGCILGALDAHLPNTAFIPGGRMIAHQAIDMQMWHAPVLAALGLYGTRTRALHIAAIALTLGLALFCTAVYAIAFVGLRLGPLAPTGGVIVMLGWIALFAAAFTRAP